MILCVLVLMQTVFKLHFPYILENIYLLQHVFALDLFYNSINQNKNRQIHLYIEILCGTMQGKHDCAHS